MPQSCEKTIKKDAIRCRAHILTCQNLTNDQNSILQWFEGLCENLKLFIFSIRNYTREQRELVKSAENSLLLYLSQLLRHLSLLINIFVKEDSIGKSITLARSYASKQLISCVENVVICLDTPDTVNKFGSSFMVWMDAALNEIASFDPNWLNNKEKLVVFSIEIRESIEEVLAHAMSISQVEIEEERKIIRGSCLSVLDALNSLEKQINGENRNKSMISLFVDVCNDKLCSLERKVNTLVLKLCLKTFAELNNPLETLKSFVVMPFNCRNSQDFDNLVADFDLHVDRLVQIGLFAVSCSTDNKKLVEIKSSLASLEALESEIVPALNLLSIDKSDINYLNVNILLDFWFEEAKTLRNAIYLIIDPFAFIQVIYNDSKDVVDILSQKLEDHLSIHSGDLKELIKIAGILKKFLTKARVEFNESEKAKLDEHFSNFKNVLDEVEASSKHLLNKKNDREQNSIRVLKRCKILLTLMKRVLLCFADNIEIDKDHSNESGNSNKELLGNVFFDRLIQRGKDILQEQSVLFTLGKSNVMKTPKLHLIKNLNARMTPGRKLPFLDRTRNESTIDLQITEFLDEFTTISQVIPG